MVSPVSNLRFNSNVYFRANEDLINSEGKYAEKPPVGEEQGDVADLSTKAEEPKKHGVLKALGYTAAALAVVIGGSFAFKKGCPSFSAEGASWYKKALVKPAEWCESGWDAVAKLFKGKGAETVAEETAEAAS